MTLHDVVRKQLNRPLNPLTYQLLVVTAKHSGNTVPMGWLNKVLVSFSAPGSLHCADAIGQTRRDRIRPWEEGVIISEEKYAGTAKLFQIILNSWLQTSRDDLNARLKSYIHVLFIT